MIRSLNLDRMFIPTPQPEIEFEMIQFNGGEMHIKLNNNIDYSVVEKVVITNRFKNSDDIIKVLITKDALQRKGVKDFDLVMPYIPYARQDRQCDEGESFTLKVFTDIINSANFNKVIVFDAHSDVAPALLNNSINKSCDVFVCEVLKDLKKDLVLISPDAGSNKKLNKLAIKFQLDLVKCDKVRDVKTGNLTGFEVFSNDLNHRDCLIVDDICDGGGTFIGLAKELIDKNAGNLYLYTTHGIFSRGYTALLSYFDCIYTTNSVMDIKENGVKQFKIQL